MDIYDNLLIRACKRCGDNLFFIKQVIGMKYRHDRHADIDDDMVSHVLFDLTEKYKPFSNANQYNKKLVYTKRDLNLYSNLLGEPEKTFNEIVITTLINYIAFNMTKDDLPISYKNTLFFKNKVAK